jgi:hypothetical protein
VGVGRFASQDKGIAGVESGFDLFDGDVRGSRDVGFDEENFPGKGRGQSAAGLQMGMEQRELMLFEGRSQLNFPDLRLGRITADPSSLSKFVFDWCVTRRLGVSA